MHRLAFVYNSLPPYTAHLIRRIREECKEVEMLAIITHDDSRWPIDQSGLTDLTRLDGGDPVQTQGQFKSSLAEWRRNGKALHAAESFNANAIFLCGYADLGRLRLLRAAKRRGWRTMLFADSNIYGDRLQGLKLTVKRSVLRRVIHWSDRLLVNGRAGRDYWLKYGANEEQIIFCPYEPDYGAIASVGPDAVKAASARLELPPNRRWIVFSGRLIDAKRPQLLIEAFQAVATKSKAWADTWGLVFLGDGPLRSELESAVLPEFKTQVVWAGFQSNPTEVIAIYKACEIMALPSTYEPWALVVNEAVACGLALVTSDVVGAAHELVEQGVNGVKVPVDDANALAEGLMKVTAEVDKMRLASADQLARWRSQADPIQGLLKALASS